MPSSSSLTGSDPQHTPPENQSSNQKPPRKLHRSANQLKRNAACLPCRRRRIKCDAAKPHCSSCVRSFHFLARTQPDRKRDAKGVHCFYNEEEEQDFEHDAEESNSAGIVHRRASGSGHATGDMKGKKRKVDDHGQGRSNAAEGDSRDAIKRLEARVAELQDALQSSTPQPAGQPETATNPNQPLLECPSMYGRNNIGAVPPISTTSEPPTTWDVSNNSTFTLPTNGIPSNASETLFTDSTAFNIGIMPVAATGSNVDAGSNSLLRTNIQVPHYSSRKTSIETSADDFLRGQNALTGNTEINAPLLQQLPPTGLEGVDSSGVDLEAGKLGGEFLELFWPGWPPRLPTPAMMDHLVETFFSMVPSVSRVLHRPTFIARLALPPAHPDFPHTAVLHSICAVTGRYSAAVKTDPVTEVILRTNEDMAGRRKRKPGASYEDEIERIKCFSERNARYAVVEMRMEEVKGSKMIEVLQAQAILVNYYQQNARWIEGWVMGGACVRSAIPLGLMQDNIPQPGKAEIRTSILAPPQSHRDREERRALMYYILSFDAVSSASSGWCNSLMYDELSASLPCSAEDFERGYDIPSNPQKYHSPDLFSYHPVVDSFVLLTKGMILLGRITKLVRRWRALGDDQRALGREMPEFRKLDSDIATFSLTFPPTLRDVLQPKKGYAKGIDADLVSAHLVPHVASILLHEPFADLTDPNCPSAARLLTEARSCLSIAYIVTSTSMDICYMLQTISSCDYFFTAARTLLLFYQRALDIHDALSASMFYGEILVFKSLFTTYGARFAMGARHAAMIEQMLKACEQGTGDSAVVITPFSALMNTYQEIINSNPQPTTWGPQDRAFEYQLQQIIDPSQTLKYALNGEGRLLNMHPDAILYSSIATTNNVTFKDLMNVKRGFLGHDRGIEYPRLVSDGDGVLAASSAPSFDTSPVDLLSSHTSAGATTLGAGDGGLDSGSSMNGGASGQQNWMGAWGGSSANVTLLSPDSGQSGGSGSGPPT